ncbi:MAG: molybdate transport system regulatory protein [Pseudomonadota bacterium]|nr:molybdate transport system regulatory protein [Pseudomonadota bacterium]
MKISARNQFKGIVCGVTVGVVNVEVQIRLKGGDIIVASITKESIDILGIKEGIDVIALVKASQIIIATNLGGYRLSARNQLKGNVTNITRGAVNSEIDITLNGGDLVAATVTNDSVANAGLSENRPAIAIFKAGSVILAVV